MQHDQFFESDENRVLMAICARRLIKGIGIGGIVWGVLNILTGMVAVLDTLINAGILVLGIAMLATGIQALRKPSIHILLAETLMAVCLWGWNVAMWIVNLVNADECSLGSIWAPLIVVIVMGNYYQKLGSVRELIASVPPAQIAATKRLCKALLKKKLKLEPLIVQTADGACRAQLLDDRAFFIHRKLLHAFVAPRDAIRSAVLKPEATRLTMVFNHPLWKLKLSFDKKSTNKLREWLAAEKVPVAVPA